MNATIIVILFIFFIFPHPLLPATHSEIGMIIWQHEYPLWCVVNAIVMSADQTLTLEFADYLSSVSSADVGLPCGKILGTIGDGISATSSECSAATSVAGTTVSAQNRLRAIVSRLATCLDFVDACLAVSQRHTVHFISLISAKSALILC